MRHLASRQSNPRRGLRHRKAAQEFFDEVKPPCVLSDAQMDEALRKIDPQYAGAGEGPHSRKVWTRRLRMAGTHSAMNAGRFFAYTVRLVRRGIWSVEAVQEAIRVGVALDMLRQAITAAKRNERYLEESVPIDQLADMEHRLIRQSAMYTLATLENCELIADTAMRAHHEMMRSMLEASKPAALRERNDDEGEE